MGVLGLLAWNLPPPSRAATNGAASEHLSRATSGRPPGIRVAGSRLVDRAGTPVVLRGVNMSGTEYACAQNHTDDPFAGQPEEDPATLAAIRSWHANVVRLPLNEDCWLGINGVRVGGAPYRAAVTGLARALEGSGFYVILDLHWSAPGGQRALSQNPAPDQDHSPAFWSSVAQTFRGDDDVLFDLFNEPYFRWEAPGGPGLWTCLWQGCTLTRYLSGGSPTTIRASWRTAGMDQLISAVRRAGARNVILVAGLDWANDLSGWLQHRSHDRNLAASWHSYPNNHCSSQSCWDRAVAPLARRVPVVVTEVGDSASRPAAYLPNLLPWCDRHHLGYLAWTWNAWPQPRNVLVTNMRTGAPTAGEGAYFRAHLERVWGSKP